MASPQHSWKFSLASSSSGSQAITTASGRLFRGEPQSAVGFFGESLGGISRREDERNAEAKLKERNVLVANRAQQIALAAGKQLPMQFVRCCMPSLALSLSLSLSLSRSLSLSLFLSSHHGTLAQITARTRQHARAALTTCLFSHCLALSLPPPSPTARLQFMMWMAGNTVGIWTMMIISGAMWGPLNNLLFNVNKGSFS